MPSSVLTNLLSLRAPRTDTLVAYQTGYRVPCLLAGRCDASTAHSSLPSPPAGEGRKWRAGSGSCRGNLEYGQRIAIDAIELPVCGIRCLPRPGLFRPPGQLAGIGGCAAGCGTMSRHCNHSVIRSEEHTSELQSLMRISYAVFCLK